MRAVLFTLFAISVTACTSAPTKTEWMVDTQDRAKYDQFMAVYNECKDFAYRSKVAGSRYTEGDIHTSCIQRRGYQFKIVQ